jgi:hypothetical protein
MWAERGLLGHPLNPTGSYPSDFFRAPAWGLVTKVAETLSIPPSSLTSSENVRDYPPVQLTLTGRRIEGIFREEKTKIQPQMNLTYI